MEEENLTEEEPRREFLSVGYRMIGSQGIERMIGPGREWAEAVRSGTITDQSLIWHPGARRWMPVSALGRHVETGPTFSPETGPASDAPSSDSRAERAGALEHGGFSNPDSAQDAAGRPRAGSARRAFLTAVVCALGLALTWAALTGEAARLSPFAATALEQVPWPIYAVVALVVAEEFLWFALVLLRVRGTTFMRRLLVQALSFLSTALAFYGLSLGRGFLDGLSALLPQNFGWQMDPTIPERIVAALSSGAPRQAAHLGIVRHPFLTGAIFGTAALVWAMLLLRKGTATQRAAATLVGAVMIVATLHMALATSLEPARGSRPRPDRSQTLVKDRSARQWAGASRKRGLAAAECLAPPVSNPRTGSRKRESAGPAFA